MRSRRRFGMKAVAIALTTSLATVGAAAARQEPTPPPPPAKAATPKTTPKGKASKGGLLAPGGGRAKAMPKAGDPLARPAQDVGKAEPGTFHYGLRIASPDPTNPGVLEPLASSYYPSRLGTGAPVVMLVHERDRSSKDFDDKIADLQGRSLSQELQKEGYAVLALDLRGHGANPRRGLSSRDWRLMVSDLQAAYTFLIDRHNRGELNLSRLGVVGVGEGANLVATWASLPGGAVSSLGRTSDLGALVLISPMIDAQSQGLRALQPVTALAPRVPLALLAGERDAASAEVVKAARAAVTRNRGNKVELFPSTLHGFKLLRLEPNAARSAVRFFDDTIKAKAEEWEPRYNLDPVGYSDVQIVPNAPDAPKAKADEAK